MSMFDLPTDADPGPPITNFRFERVSAVTDTKDIVGKAHIFRVEPSGGDWWVPSKSYFRARLQVVVGYNNSRYPSWSAADSSLAAKETAQPTSWPFPPQVGELSDNDLELAEPIGRYLPTTKAQMGTYAISNDSKYSLQPPYHDCMTGLGGESMSFLSGSATNLTLSTDLASVFQIQSQAFSQNGISYFRAFKPFTALKFVEIADSAVDAFFDQMSFNIGPTRVETVRYPQLVSVMNKRTKFGAQVNSSRFNTLGVFGDEQTTGNKQSNRLDGKTSVFDVLGYSNISVSASPNWEQEYVVAFDVLYVPPLSVFDLPHALPSARYEIELKGVSSHQEIQANFFHVTMPGGTGRYFMDKTDAADGAGALNANGPAALLDGKHSDERKTVSQHPPGSIFVFEPPVCAGPKINEISQQAHYMGRGMIETSWLKTRGIDRNDPGNFISVTCQSLHMEAAMVSGPVLTDSTFMFQFDQLCPRFLPLTGSATSQSLIFDVDPMANHFMFGFRPTTVSNDPCLQEGHLICPANVERDLVQYYISFDMKTRPTNFATEIDLTSCRGAYNEMVRSQINNMTLYANTPESARSWLKKGPYYAYDWPRDGTSNATRFQLNLTFTDPNANLLGEKTMGPHGMFENEMPLVYTNPLAGFQAPSKVYSATTWVPGASNEGKFSNSYKLVDHTGVSADHFKTEANVFQEGLLWRAPTLWYSLYYPANLALLRKQVRIDAVERLEPSRIRCQKPLDAAATNSTIHNVFTMIRSGLESAYAASHNLGSVAEHDRGYKGTEHSRPNNTRLGDANNSCVLFESIPRKWIITTASGRVIAARTIDNRI